MRSGDRLGNAIGIIIDGSSSNTIGPATIVRTTDGVTIGFGSASAPAGNIISASQQEGILIEDNSAGNAIEGDTIGSAGNTLLDSISGVANGTGLSLGANAPGNTIGIEFQSGAVDNTIGSTIAGAAYIVNPGTGAVERAPAGRQHDHGQPAGSGSCSPPTRRDRASRATRSRAT